MQIDIQTKNLELSTNLHKRIEKRVRHMYGNLKRDVKKITLRLHNESDADQGIVGFCKIQVQTRGLPVIYAEQKSSDLYAAVLAASTRAKLNVSRRINKFNRLLRELRKLKKQKTKHRTLRLFKHEANLAGDFS
ncbi:MAG: hypothetical protein AB8B92_10925 [Gammaproteobacteria bacterium]